MTHSFTETKPFTYSGAFSLSDSFTPWATRTPVQTFLEISVTEVASSTLSVTETIIATVSFIGSRLTETVSFLNGEYTGVQTWIEEYAVSYMSVNLPIYLITMSAMELILKKPPEELLKINTTLFIGLISGSAVVLATIGFLVVWIIRRNRVETSEADEEEEEFELQLDGDWGGNDNLWENGAAAGELDDGYTFVDDPFMDEDW